MKKIIVYIVERGDRNEYRYMLSQTTTGNTKKEKIMFNTADKE